MKRLWFVVMMLAACAAGADAQGAQGGQKPGTAAPAPAPSPAPEPLRRAAAAADVEPFNVRYQIAIREIGGPQPSTKTVSLTISAGSSSSVRAQGTARGNHPLNVDVQPRASRDDRVLTIVGVEYTPLPPEGHQGPPPLLIRESLSVWLQSGKPLVISEAADPISDRRITIEVTATIIR